MIYLYVDESGDLGNQSRFFIIAAISTENYTKLNRIIKNMRRNKFRKELKSALEIKANNSSKELISYMINKINELDRIDIFCVVLDKTKIKSEFLKNDKNKLYNFVAGKILNLINCCDDLIIRIDKSKGNQLLRDDFDNYLKLLFKRQNFDKKLDIHHSYSHSWSGLQFADILAWAFYQQFEHQNSEYVNLLKINPKINYIWKEYEK
jgi:hypothetical protein